MPDTREPSKFPVVEHLFNLRKRDDRGTLATLRRGMSLTVKEMMGSAIGAHVWPHLPQDASYREKYTAFAVAALFAGYCAGKGRDVRGEKKAGNFGTTMRRVWEACDKNPSFEQRFVVILDASAEAVYEQLQQAVQHARYKEIPIDWEQLYEHLRAWNYKTGYVQQKWAESFWRTISYVQRKKEESECA